MYNYIKSTRMTNCFKYWEPKQRMYFGKVQHHKLYHIHRHSKYIGAGLNKGLDL